MRNTIGFVVDGPRFSLGMDQINHDDVTGSVFHYVKLRRLQARLAAKSIGQSVRHRGRTFFDRDPLRSRQFMPHAIHHNTLNVGMERSDTTILGRVASEGID